MLESGMNLQITKQIIYFDALTTCPHCGNSCDYYNLYRNEVGEEMARCFLCQNDIKGCEIRNAEGYMEILIYANGPTLVNGEEIAPETLSQYLE